MQFLPTNAAPERQPHTELQRRHDAATTVQRACINQQFVPPTRYGFPVVNNKCGQAFEGDAVEMYIALVPTVPEIQNA